MVKKEKNAIKSSRRREFWFALCIVIVPLAWWAWTFVYTTSDSILMAFKSFDKETGIYSFVGLANFGKTISEFFMSGSVINIALKNSVLLWLVQLCVMIPITLIVSFALYKKVYGHGMFKVILFLPQIISGMVWVLAYKYILEDGFALEGVLDYTNPNTKYTLWIYTLWLGFAGNMVIYTGAMSRIPPSLVEAGHLDGMTDIKEFYHIVLPLIFPTLSVVLITCVMSIFTIQLPAFSFFSMQQAVSSDMNYVYTFGYYNFVKGLSDNEAVPQISALSMMTCLIAAPVSLGVKSLLNKIGPTVEY